MTDKLDTVSIRIPKRLKEKLKKRAEEKLIPMSQIVREAIAEKLWREKADDVES